MAASPRATEFIKYANPEPRLIRRIDTVTASTSEHSRDHRDGDRVGDLTKHLSRRRHRQVQDAWMRGGAAGGSGAGRPSVAVVVEAGRPERVGGPLGVRRWFKERANPDVGAFGSARVGARATERGLTMTNQASQGSRLPRDVHARERLREAQQAESGAVSAVYAASGALERAFAKREAAVAAADATVDQARAVLATAQAALVRVSGLDRAAALLGSTKVELRRTIAFRAPQEPEVVERLPRRGTP